MGRPLPLRLRRVVSDAERDQCRTDPRQAVREHEIICLVCARGFRHLTNTHLESHGMTSVTYKIAYGYNLRRPLMCHTLRRLYAERAVQVRLAERIRRRP